MKTKLFFLALLAGAFVLSSVSPSEYGPTETLCHNGITIKVYKSAVNAHLLHGDTIGACN